MNWVLFLGHLYSPPGSLRSQSLDAGCAWKKKEKRTLKLKKERKEDPSTPRTNKKRPFPFFPQFELKVGEKSCELDYIFSSWCAEQE